MEDIPHMLTDTLAAELDAKSWPILDVKWPSKPGASPIAILPKLERWPEYGSGYRGRV